MGRLSFQWTSPHKGFPSSAALSAARVLAKERTWRPDSDSTRCRHSLSAIRANLALHQLLIETVMLPLMQLYRRMTIPSISSVSVQHDGRQSDLQMAGRR